ncbi:MAG: DUF5696 domain-containing protein [Armatimonadetes bacterium]|nr:DUF5696 domain-containing protein [Armatimonadota bacterium]MDW8121136.1 DUF5696 domain-containing protein [Armatimonadota bacterium]
MARWALLAMVVSLIMSTVAAFDPPEAKVGSLLIRIKGPSMIGQAQVPVPMSILISNAGRHRIVADLSLKLIDGWRAQGPDPARVTVAGGETIEVPFSVVAAADSYRAHYPVHLFARWTENGKSHNAHCVLVTEFVGPRAVTPVKDPTVRLTDGGSVALWRTGKHQVLYESPTGKLLTMPTGWWGTEEETGTHSVVTEVDRGGRKAALAVHPPWRKGPGTMFLEWMVQLPKKKPLLLDLSFAIRDHDPQKEPPSDGVTVRAWVGILFDPAVWKKVKEVHSDSKTWVPFQVDLSEFAGQTIGLRLEVHPGPKNDTTCDLAFLGEPYLLSGRQPPLPVTAPKSDRVQTTDQATTIRLFLAQKALQWGLVSKADEPILRRLLKSVKGQRSTVSAEWDKDLRQALSRITVPSGTSLMDTQINGKGMLWAVAQDGELFGFAVNFTAAPPGVTVLSCPADKEPVVTRPVAFISGSPLGDWRSPWVVTEVSVKGEKERLTIVYRLSKAKETTTVTNRFWVTGGCLKVQWELKPLKDQKEPFISDLLLGPWNRSVDRLYLGHGNVIVHPQAFTLYPDGHFVATRHFGLDFDNGVHLVIGTDTPPDHYEHDPSMRISTLHTHMNSTWTFAVSGQSVWSAARRYRTVDPYQASEGVPRLAGRFVFDLWLPDPYKEAAEQLKRSFAYGCTESVVIYHNWQRFGYDYRLPDIFPPNPQYGSLSDFQYLAQTCRQRGVLFALHDNYIDFYPDAEGFSYDKICFTEGGEPVRAWFNSLRGAQSYRWRPDSFQPFMERNLKAIRESIAPTAYFVDVFSSIRAFDWWTRDGQFHDFVETQRLWGEAFRWIRDFLKGAPQISESGCDWLIGWLDGATANHLRVDPTMPNIWSVWRIPCQDAERIPWFDFAHRHRFVLHGAGYSDRYQGGLSYSEHGIYSDDYIVTEVLTGHPAMVRDPFSSQAIRKYWLLSDLMKALALVPMSNVEFVDGDIHRQKITYANGAVLWVNRSGRDWKVNGRILPPFGFYAEVPETTKASLGKHPLIRRPRFVRAAIERLPTVDGDSVIAEWSESDRFIYFNGRAPFREAITLRSAKVSLVSDNRLKINLHWSADRATEVPYRVFVHFLPPALPQPASGPERIIFQADHDPPVPTTEWSGEVVTEGLTTIPENLTEDHYRVLVGLYYPEDHSRAPITDSDDIRRVFVGNLVLERRENKIVGVRLEPPPPVSERWNRLEKPVVFAWGRAAGGYRYDRQNRMLLILPGQGTLPVTLKWSSFGDPKSKLESVREVSEEGKELSVMPITNQESIVFTPRPDAFGYRFIVREGKRRR